MSRIPQLDRAAQAFACSFGPQGCAAYDAANTYAWTGDAKAARRAGLKSFGRNSFSLDSGGDYGGGGDYFTSAYLALPNLH
ncbi:hypothetical protein AB835_12975 [Candidatus Endobugula sertula]|uniref:Uncharacterized protein n=1 Tax=Candidatus Endobugula sertula TaxID=62101 RepID=A0A1D2QM55_9GAMM|nr:hypothetical protein AB835_12975 [Candidatus Endobugula sertula]